MYLTMSCLFFFDIVAEHQVSTSSSVEIIFMQHKINKSKEIYFK